LYPQPDSVQRVMLKHCLFSLWHLDFIGTLSEQLGKNLYEIKLFTLYIAGSSPVPGTFERFEIEFSKLFFATPDSFSTSPDLFSSHPPLKSKMTK
jgi:hypothetical protein